ncbi:hypothetical protein UAW_02489 [Enterococcus haemoperoxidus ATCC BAA-382]|uniref:Uncharacterized protein n=1 Tax=Enterococcus haemoperoxidus ATCC BAA-382 TaxID=1158608 RepID=R2SZV1_9ENTE|nr:hypothetical protein [Enterococcus haemoperoxidus]EOH93539.1 hypothetical protein UAW_02489 [Enterococcus haemoperoxidus ATCC BAA-382]EOT63374.1 hypothetical protein I583_00174 [Enterococcus haemoperoxidus ATCC BAA-382]OJG50749.1 hypothetical protein RV06_GL001668 [Enterococcus haemoperoxidus]
MKKLLLISSVILGTLFMQTADASAATLKDTNGDDVVGNRNYVIKANPEGFKAKYWKTRYVDVGSDWVNLTTDKDNGSSYQLVTNGIVQENVAYKIYDSGSGKYLNYQAGNTVWYPMGGVYMGAKNGSINWKFSLSDDGKSYKFSADDGPIYTDVLASMSLVTSNKNSHENFTVEFVRK